MWGLPAQLRTLSHTRHLSNLILLDFVFAERLVFGDCNMRALPAQLRQLLNGSEPLVGADVAVTVVTDDGSDR